MQSDLTAVIEIRYLVTHKREKYAIKPPLLTRATILNNPYVCRHG